MFIFNDEAISRPYKSQVTCLAIMLLWFWKFPINYWYKYELLFAVFYIETSSPVECTSVPRNKSELQLFCVLQRAILLSFFDVMIGLKGDDVQQLCEAGEEEFLEIMVLKGMASRPLHVRRLQKALQEWMINSRINNN